MDSCHPADLFAGTDAKIVSLYDVKSYMNSSLDEAKLYVLFPSNQIYRAFA
jgi:hypothetical protein